MTEVSHQSNQSIQLISFDLLQQPGSIQPNSLSHNKSQGQGNRITLLKSLQKEKLVGQQNVEVNTPQNNLEVGSLKESQYTKSEIQDNEDNQKVVINLHEIDSFRKQQQKFKQVVSTDNSVDEVQSMIIRALQKKPKERRSSDMNALIKITENLPFFRKYAEDGQKEILAKCCQQMEIEIFERDQNVFEIEGEVDVYAKVPNSQVQPAQIPPNGQQTSKNGMIIQQFPQQSEKELIEQQSQFNNQQVKPGTNEISFISKYSQAANNKNSQYESQDVKNPSRVELGDSSPIKRQNLNVGSDSSPIKRQNQGDATSKQRNVSNITTFQSEMLSSVNVKKLESPNKLKFFYNSKQLDSIKDLNTPVAEGVQLMLVKRLKEGESFGELALIYNKPRLATIKCTTRCTFAVLEKKQYLDILKNAEEKNIVKQIDKLSEIPMFKQWSFEFLKDIYLNSELVNFRKNDIVFQKGDPSSAVYIVQQGEFSVRNKYNSPQQCFENDAVLQKLDSMSREGIDTLLKTHGNSKQRTFTLLNMCTNEMFGEEDLLKDQNRSFEVFCSSFQGQLLMIKDIDFRLRIFERNDYIQDYILNRLQTKELFLQQKEQNLMEQFSKYKNFLVENRQELKNIIFSQILMDQSCSLPVQQSPKVIKQSQYTQGSHFSPSSNSSMSPSKFKQMKSVESSRGKQNSFQRLHNTVGTQHSVMSANFDQLSPRSITKNDFAQNSQSLHSQQDSKQFGDLDYYQINQSPKLPYRQHGMSAAFRIQSQRSHSDSSRNYTKTSYNPRPTLEFLDNFEDLNNIPLSTQDKRTINEIDELGVKKQTQQYQQQQSTSLTSPQQFRIKQNLNTFNKTPERMERMPQQKKQNIYNESFFEDKEISIFEDKQQDFQQPTSKQSNQSPNSSTQTGFFQIEVSKRKRIMLAPKYDYQNYLQDKDNENRYLIPVKKILSKALKEKKPLLIDLAHQKQQDELYQGQQTTTSDIKKNQQLINFNEKVNGSEKQNPASPSFIKAKNPKNIRQLNIQTNANDIVIDNSKSAQSNNKTKSYYQYQIQNFPDNTNDSQYYDIQSNVTSSPNKMRSKFFTIQRQSCKSADSKRIVQDKSIQRSDDNPENEGYQIHQQIITQKREQIRSKTPKIFNQLIQFQITPFTDDVYIQNDKFNQTSYSKKSAVPTFIEQDQYLKQINLRSPTQNVSPKKVIESYKQFLSSKQQTIEKSKKLGAFTAFNKTKDTSFYIQKRVEKRMIQTMTDWRRSSQAVKNSEFVPYNVQQISNTMPMKKRSSLSSAPQQQQNLNLSLQPEKMQQIIQEKKMHNRAFQAHRNSLNNAIN